MVSSKTFNFLFTKKIKKKKKRVNLKSISRESNAVNSEMSAPWAETTLSTILSKYKLNDIFNADKFGLFYQCLSNKTNPLLGEICYGGKNSKAQKQSSRSVL